MAVVAQTHFVNKKIEVTADEVIKILDTDGFRASATVVNSDQSSTVFIGGLMNGDDLQSVGAPLYPGAGYSTKSISALYAIVEKGKGPVDVRIMTEEECKTFTTPTMHGLQS